MRGFKASDLPTGGRLWRTVGTQAAGPELLLVHGAYHGAWCWQDWAERWCAEGIPVAVVDMPGRPGVPTALPLAELGVQHMARCVASAAEVCAQPLIGVGHSLGALILAKAAETQGFDGLVLLAPSPPGNLKGASAVPAKPYGAPVDPPSLESYNQLYFGASETAAEWHDRLCPESPAALNDRYRQRVPVRKDIAPRGLVLEAGREDRKRHPKGQDAAVARHFGFQHLLLPDAAHCMMHRDVDGGAFEAVTGWVLEPAHASASAVGK
ncbi:alpha/beta hydrolase [Boseongicola sp. H5]|uniref:alpha/beta hydrolase n=1 Tax=Boseongicola sp. H5 TaxID=2763261 RepID=UPI001D09D23C|nr:alpha/beta hydrolase [Boseongicola sp. H5]